MEDQIRKAYPLERVSQPRIATKYVYFVPHPRQREAIDPRLVKAHFIKIRPPHDAYAIINVPLPPDTYKVAIGFKMRRGATNPNARVVFTDDEGVGSLTDDVPDSPHQNMLRGWNEVRIAIPEKTEGREPNTAHFFVNTPIETRVVYDLRNLRNGHGIVGYMRSKHLQKFQCNLADQVQYFKDQLNFIYKGGKSFKKDFLKMAHEYHALSMRYEWSLALPRQIVTDTKRFVSMLATQNKYETARNAIAYRQLSGWERKTIAKRETQREQNLKEFRLLTTRTVALGAATVFCYYLLIPWWPELLFFLMVAYAGLVVGPPRRA